MTPAPCRCLAAGPLAGTLMGEGSDAVSYVHGAACLAQPRCTAFAAAPATPGSTCHPSSRYAGPAPAIMIEPLSRSRHLLIRNRAARSAIHSLRPAPLATLWNFWTICSPTPTCGSPSLRGSRPRHRPVPSFSPLPLPPPSVLPLWQWSITGRTRTARTPDPIAPMTFSSSLSDIALPTNPLRKLFEQVSGLRPRFPWPTSFPRTCTR